MAKRQRNYKKEAAYEDRPEQVKRRVARNRARRKAIKKYGKERLRGKELDHIGHHRLGSLDHVPTRVVSKKKNRSRQPPTKARGKARNSR